MRIFTAFEKRQPGAHGMTACSGRRLRSRNTPEHWALLTDAFHPIVSSGYEKYWEAPRQTSEVRTINTSQQTIH